MAKRAHAEKFVPLLIEALTEAQMLEPTDTPLSEEKVKKITELCTKEQILGEAFIPFFNTYKKPDIDHIAVTTGPGLEPALWVGINAAKVLSAIWNIPLIPINHMEGHVLVTLLDKKDERMFDIRTITFPALALLVSGGHTELVLMQEYGQYEKIGQTRDDAVGEAFDKVARILGLPYPGGPAISKMAVAFRASEKEQPFTLPRPMLHSGDYDFSYSGIKTAVLYTVRDHGDMSEDDKMALACAFEDGAIEVLITKTMRAVQEYNIATLIVGGGVAGNTYLRSQLAEVVQKKSPNTTLLFPEQWLSTDNSVMIGIAAYMRLLYGNSESQTIENITANGNLSITQGGYKK
jgi:N6-L-threonylcarbamoyladenine synthase